MFKVLVVIITSVSVYGIPLSQECGKQLNRSLPDWRIVGGRDAAVGEFPWFSLLTLPVQHEKYAEQDFCGGSIINEKWILTAAHCVPTDTNKTYEVRLAVHNMTAHEHNEIDIYVEKVLPHKAWDDNKGMNDIALLKLNESLQFNGKHKHLRPICLPTSATKLTNKCVSCGFGNVDTMHPHQPKNGILQKVNVPLNDPEVCKKEFSGIFNEPTEICAGAESGGGHSVCDGDSGGPLQCEAENGRWYIVGIVSYGSGMCGAPKEAGVFTKVSAYLNWIEENIANN